MAGFAQAPAQETSLAPLGAAKHWLGAPAELASLQGKVVLVDVFTFDCINCANVVPNLRRLHATLDPHQFAIVGIDTPEVPSYQSDRRYAVAHAREQGLLWPIALDNGNVIWGAFGIDSWPTQLIFDRHGVLRYRIVGDSQDDAVNRAVTTLLRS